MSDTDALSQISCKTNPNRPEIHIFAVNHFKLITICIWINVNDSVFCLMEQ